MRRRGWLRWLTGACAVTVGSMAVLTGAPAPVFAADGTPGWRVDEVPLNAVLYDVASVDGGDTWAVGSEIGADFGFSALALRWDRGRWTRVEVPEEAGDRFDGVDGIAADDVWAVGSVAIHSRITHWDGRRWTPVPVEEPVGTSSTLVRVDAVTPHDAWAVGSVQTADAGHRGIVQHWNGHRWSLVALPDTDFGDYFLSAVTAVSPTDVWVAGTASGQPLVLHWNGRRWARAALPRLDGVTASLEGLSTHSAHELWAVGWTQTGGVGTRRPLALRFDGNAWTLDTTTPDEYGQMIDAVSWKGDIWAVGYGVQPSLYRRHGVRWTSVRTPDYPDAAFFAVTTTPGRGLLAVGGKIGPEENPFQPLIARYGCGPC